MIKKLSHTEIVHTPWIMDIVAKRLRDRQDKYALVAIKKNDYDMSFLLKYELYQMEAVPDFDW